MPSQPEEKLLGLPKKELALALKEGKTERKKAQRRLTQHVVSRAYRSPEVILLEKEYSSPVDIWSAGCILSEMLTSTVNYKHDSHNKVLFPGDSCYPLSPTKEENPESSPTDTLTSILQTMGHQDTADRSFLTSS